MMKRSTILSAAGVILLSAVIALPVMADGDSPRDVYSDYIDAAQDGDLDEICKYVSDGKAQQIQSLSESARDDLSRKMKRITPTEFTVTKEQINGIHATLFLTGKSANSRSYKGKARFIKEGDEWKLEREMWQ